MVIVDESNLMDYALRHYIVDSVSWDEMLVDIQRISLINQSLKRFVPGKSPRLILNQLITLFNTFEAEAVCRMLVLKTDRSQMPRLKAALLTIGVWRDDLCSGSYEPDNELMMALNNDLGEWRKPCQQSLY
ncbi:hypothetical protein HQ81_0181 [Dickeya phage phiDP23.1]|uniref:Uncharacterized protein n=15 Tax=Aglimvirinae TaxID=2169530 RepID=I0J2M9_9CAUD|nr:hypothetical protein G379_gp199 [Dickeya phage vB-DsoM-LIMEstone1]AIM51289.1 hypothetical protein HQ80_0010 [Dickeya phage phiD3]AIM51575.1 hypothetical protein HQ82_0053 [Dickeya phage phiDP10.3]AIM51989.1 hypothetical protein HQ81_0181 [Dickeya phage phiDP23.1]ASD51192.1 hypothetical protein [Dickeya phage JA15]ASD51391.1 hypothetical protein [Dickeya phage XF4]ATW62011.1 hypothetical protein [Dickeya phage PP35]AYN55583.1 hypothetical protein [Dickeya phage Kamild]QHB41507.1 hypotheti